MLELEQVGLWLATSRGLLAQRPGDRGAGATGLRDVDVRELALGPEGALFAGTWGDGIFRSFDGGRTFERVTAGVPSDTVTALAAASESAAIVYAGFEPAAFAASTDAGASWQNFRELRMAPDASDWWAPWGTPDLSAVLVDPADPQRVYVGIEVGGAYVTEDGGQTFEARKEGLHEDVHALAAHAAAPGVLWAATGGGIHRSEDRGCTWEECNDGLDRTYTPPIALHPEEPNVAVTAPGKLPPGRNSRLYRTDDAGESWHPLTEGLPEEFEGVERRAIRWTPEGLFVGTVEGDVWVSGDDGDSWTRVATSLPPVHALVVGPLPPPPLSRH